MWIPLVSEHGCARRHFSLTHSGIGASGATNETHDGLVSSRGHAPFGDGRKEEENATVNLVHRELGNLGVIGA